MSKITTPKGFSGILKLLSEHNKSASEQGSPQVTEYLARVGRETIAEMFRKKYPGNELYNQRDAFGYGIYYKGKLIKEGYLDGEKSRAPSKRRRQRGREQAKLAISGYTPMTDGYELYFVNAMHYSKAQEEYWGQPVLVDSEIFKAESRIKDKLKVDVKVIFDP